MQVSGVGRDTSMSLSEVHLVQDSHPPAGPPHAEHESNRLMLQCSDPVTASEATCS